IWARYRTGVVKHQEARLHQAHASLLPHTLRPLAVRLRLVARRCRGGFDHHLLRHHRHSLRLRFDRHRRSFVHRCRRSTHGSSLALRRCRGCQRRCRQSRTVTGVANASPPAGSPQIYLRKGTPSHWSCSLATRRPP
ncbi:unnamed protein product, partial [Ectocarpus sp. 4 AP-2014]